MKNILEEITLTDVLIIYLIQNIFTKSPNYIIDKDIQLNNPFELEEENNKKNKKDEKIKKVKAIPVRNFNIDNAHSTIRKVDDYLHRANKIKNKTIHLKNAKKEEQQQFLFNEIKHRLGSTYKKAENIANFLPLIADMFSMNKEETDEKKEIEKNENISDENIENSEEFNQIYELVDLLSN